MTAKNTLYPDLTPFYRDPEVDCHVMLEETHDARGGAQDRAVKTNLYQVIKSKLSDMNRFSKSKSKQSDEMMEKLFQKTHQDDEDTSNSTVNNPSLPRKIPTAPLAVVDEHPYPITHLPALGTIGQFERFPPGVDIARGTTQNGHSYITLRASEFPTSDQEQGQMKVSGFVNTRDNFHPINSTSHHIDESINRVRPHSSLNITKSLNNQEIASTIDITNPTVQSSRAMHGGSDVSLESAHPAVSLMTYEHFRNLYSVTAQKQKCKFSPETCLSPKSDALDLSVPSRMAPQNQEDLQVPSGEKGKSVTVELRDNPTTFQDADYQYWVNWRRKMNAHLSTIILLNPDREEEAQLRRQKFREQPSQKAVETLHFRAISLQETRLGERTYYMFGIPRVSCGKAGV